MNSSRSPVKVLFRFVNVSSDLSFTKHIETAHNKAMRMLGFICRNSRDNRNNPICWKTLYYAPIRPILQYVAVLWNPYQSILINTIEKLQNNV